MSARAIWDGDTCLYRIEAECAQFDLGRGALKLRRCIDIPLGGREIRVSDRVSVASGSVPVMAMYHVNLGFPFAVDSSVRKAATSSASLFSSAVGGVAQETLQDRWL